MANKIVTRVSLKPGSRVHLNLKNPKETFGYNKETAAADLAPVMERLDHLQHRLFAEGKQALLVVLQARDAAGKDGVIRTVFTGLNPAGLRVTSFKVPAGAEAEHDYLWRVHAAVPQKGQIGVFNRSHYEDVLVVRVRNLVPEARWSKRFEHIRNFEQMLADEGTTIVKLFLNISSEEQRERFQDRIDDPEEQWKFRAGDLEDRKLWDKYTKAYDDALTETNTADAPWFVIPADHKWARNLAVANVLVDALERMDPQLPPAEPGIEGLKVE
jgi:PPK2 family polyphosphate:nucleotide phosphotransferase